ncbi:transposase [Methylocaldum szegediense]|uniref:Mutator family transposase n=1 Tax=Methylocaldum szegediense TaxID=73780 RepID=A0ABN8X0S7_9GAMM|nr:transposase [Methylocaldum szegediense]
MTSDTAKQDALLDELLKGYSDPKDILGEHGLLKQLTKRLVERALEAEMTAHVGYAPHAPEGRGSGNSRNGKHTKTIQTETGAFEIEVPRDRNGAFEPQLVPKRQRRLEGFDDKVLALYARGLSTRDIQGHLEELYGVEVSPTLISNVTESVLEEVKAWQSRPLASVYPILYFDALIVKSRETGPVKNKAVYLALGVTPAGREGTAGPLDRGHGRRQVLASRLYRAEEPGRSGLFHRLRGRAQRAAGSGGSRVSKNPGSTVYRP